MKGGAFFLPFEGGCAAGERAPSEGRLEMTPGDLALANASVYQRNAAAAVREENGGEVLPSEEPAEAHSCRRTSE